MLPLLEQQNTPREEVIAVSDILVTLAIGVVSTAIGTAIGTVIGVYICNRRQKK